MNQCGEELYGTVTATPAVSQNNRAEIKNNHVGYFHQRSLGTQITNFKQFVNSCTFESL